MEEIINFLIEIANYLKYGKFVNRNKSFEKDLENAEYITDSKADRLREIASKQLSDVLIKGDSIPTYAFFKRKKQDWYELFIINEQKKLYCRLNITQIPNNNLPDRFYLSI